MVEKERTVASTKMNDTSSRNHLLVFLKMYKKVGDNICINSLGFIDLAGSERKDK